LFDGCILPNQRGFFNFNPQKFRINRGIGVTPKIRDWFYANHCISPSQAEKTV
jgi:hypothetical protein